MSNKNIEKKTLRIVFIGVKAIPLWSSGIARIVQEIGPRLVEKGHDVTVYVRRGYYKEPSKIPKHYKGMRIIPIFSIPTKHLDALSNTFLATIHACFSNSDVIHFMYTPLSWLAIFPKLWRIKTVIYILSLEWNRPKWGRFARYILLKSEWAAANVPDMIIACSKGLQSRFKSIFNKDVIYVPPGLNPMPYVEPNEILKLNLEKDNFLLYLGRVEEGKGVHYLIEAYNNLNTTKKLVIAGAFAYSENYYRKLKNMSGDGIIFLGAIKGDLWAELFNHAYLFIQPSESEGLSNAILEAMSAGLCTLVSDIEPNLEAINKYGFTFQNKNSKDLADKLRMLLNEEEIVRETGRLARKHVLKYFNWDSSADLIGRLYRSMFSDTANSLANEREALAASFIKDAGKSKNR